MKKFLRFLLILILLIAAIVVILGIIEPKDINVERSLTMNAPREVVWNQLVNFKNWTNWSPWYRMDSTMKLDYQGTDGQPGSSYHWVGDAKKSGEGTMTNAGADSGTLKYNLAFMKPRESKADGWIKTEETGGQTKVTWHMHMHCGFPWNAMLAFMDMDKMLGKDFEAGLKNLKEYSEAHAMDMPSADIKETQFPGHIYCGVHKTVGWNDMHQFFMDAYSMLGKELNSRIAGPATGLYWTWDTVKHNADMAAVFPVTDTTKAVKGAGFFNVSASSACMVAYNGAYSGMMAPHMALMKYCASKNMKVKLVVEEYIKGPHEEKDSTKYVTNIYYLCDGMGNMADAKK